ncbi:hypothetical protein Gdia_0560 [Gluconacetobacter diazotrophicus PA1 5]|uniref:hypothetical protein n=1 Tax=Gluconacetobacter diazotrophicus TaxID=33996 RepID=UPI000173B376|nr:hypothetical protein [Gluconacetobacter diazotrophicus]ACI50353.1 hypothetical protein Gdia_0560 [Gluconacetobacter diazotrophicus PA1 5]
MLESLTTTEIVCPVPITLIQQYIGVLDPSQTTIIQMMANSITRTIENRIGNYIIQRPIVWVCSKSRQDQSKDYYDSWLSSGISFGWSWNQTISQWITLPTSAVSIESVSIARWGEADVLLVGGDDYVADLETQEARIQFSFYDYVSEFYNSYAHLVVNYTGGICAGTTDDPVPSSIQYVICELTKRLFEKRGEPSALFTVGIETMLNEHMRYAIA